jgi:ATP phosphoribosyltransferase
MERPTSESTGKDTLLEHGGEGLYQPLDLQIAKCRMMRGSARRFRLRESRAARALGSAWQPSTLTIAREHFASEGRACRSDQALRFSMELAPLAGLADVIVDLVSSGKTLKANNLVEVEQIMDISSRLVVNQAALKLKQAAIRPILDAFTLAIQKVPSPS